MKDQPETLTPKLRFPEFHGAPGWKATQLRTLATPVTERANQEDACNVLTLSAEHGVVLQSEYFGKRVAGNDSGRYIRIARNDFVYNDRTTQQSVYGTIKRLSAYESGIVSPIYKCFRFNTGEDPEFWEWYFASGTHDTALGGLVNEGARAGRFNISPERFLSTTAWRPSDSEQRKIAACLTSLENSVAAEGWKLDALRAHKKGLMEQLFPREGETRPLLRFPEFRNAPEWTVHPLDKFVVTSFYGTSHATSNKGRYPVLRMGNMVDGGLDVSTLVYIDLDEQEFESIRLMDGDLLLNRTNSMDLVGKISIFRLPGDYITASYIVTYRMDSDQLDPPFCNLMLNTPQYQRRIKALARPSVSQANINPTAFRKELIITVPPMAEQQRIAACLSSLEAVIAAQSRKFGNLRAHRRGLMQQLFPSPLAD